MSFSFSGPLDISKSWMNRALILKSYQPEIEIVGESESDDVKFLEKCLEDLRNGKTEFFVGLGGTTFRFLALRLSRRPGKYKIMAEPRLFKRPQTELVSILQQLGIKAWFQNDVFMIESDGWKPLETLKVSGQDSSQFLSSVLLNSIDLPFDLKIEARSAITSESYFFYTQELMKSYGFIFENQTVHKNQKLTTKQMVGEVDVSSFFSLATAAVLAGDVHLTNWNQKSLQPDLKFLEFFNQMGIRYRIQETHFYISQQHIGRPLQASLAQCPDLFPVLSVLCAFADGESHLFGAEQLKHKESNRIEKTAELLSLCGFKIEKLNDGLKIFGDPQTTYKKRNLVTFDPDHDHRMAFAASLMHLKNYPVLIKDPLVIKKSYPQFYQHTGIAGLT